MEHCNLVQSVRVMELLLRDEVCTCRETIKTEAVRVENNLENRLGLMRTEIFGTLRDLRLALEEGGADLSNQAPPEEHKKGPEAALKPASSGRPIPATSAAMFTPLTEEPHEERFARLDEAIEREVAARAELDRRLQKEVADLSHQFRMAVALGLEDSHCKALVSNRQHLQEPGETRRVLFSGDWGKGGKDDPYNGASENLHEVSDSKDFGFGRLQSLLRAQQQQQQRQELLGTAAVGPVASLPAMTTPALAMPVPPAEGQASSVGLLWEQEDLRRGGAVCEAVRHEALRDLLDYGSRR